MGFYAETQTFMFVVAPLGLHPLRFGRLACASRSSMG